MTDSAYIDLHQVVPKVQSSRTSAVVPNTVAAGSLKSNVVFDEIKKLMKDEPETAKRLNAVFAYRITKDGNVVAEWTVDTKKLEVYNGAPKGIKADAIITISDEDMADLAVGKLDPQMAFLKGKLKVSGNIMLADKMRTILRSKSKL